MQNFKHNNCVILTTGSETESSVSVNTPLRQRVQRNKVDFKLAVGIRQDAARVLNNPSVSAGVRTEVQPRLVVVVGVQVVPYRHLSLHNSTDVFHRVDGNLL